MRYPDSDLYAEPVDGETAVSVFNQASCLLQETILGSQPETHTVITCPDYMRATLRGLIGSKHFRFRRIVLFVNYSLHVIVGVLLLVG